MAKTREIPEDAFLEFTQSNGIWKCPYTCLQSDRTGTIPLKIAEEAYKEYVAQGHGSQSFQRLYERGGFGSAELSILLYARIKRLENSLELALEQTNPRPNQLKPHQAGSF